VQVDFAVSDSLQATSVLDEGQKILLFTAQVLGQTVETVKFSVAVSLTEKNHDMSFKIAVSNTLQTMSSGVERERKKEKMKERNVRLRERDNTNISYPCMD